MHAAMTCSLQKSATRQYKICGWHWMAVLQIWLLDCRLLGSLHWGVAWFSIAPNHSLAVPSQKLEHAHMQWARKSSQSEVVKSESLPRQCGQQGLMQVGATANSLQPLSLSKVKQGGESLFQCLTWWGQEKMCHLHSLSFSSCQLRKWNPNPRPWSVPQWSIPNAAWISWM